MLSKSRKGIQSDKYIKKRRKQGIILSILIVVVIGSFLSTLAFLSRAKFFHIDTVVVMGTVLVPRTSIESIVASEIGGSYMHLFAKDNIFLYPSDNIREDITHDLPPVSQVSFKRNGFHELDVTVTERKASGQSCDSTTGDCYFIDEQGFVYAKAPQFSPGVYITYASASTTPTLGTYLAGPEYFEPAHQAINFFSSMGLTVHGITIPNSHMPISAQNDDYSIALKNPTIGTTTTDIVVYFNTSAPLDRSFTYFTAFWNHETNKNFKTIDLRYGKDIVYTMQ